jgi:hypothetical protein
MVVAGCVVLTRPAPGHAPQSELLEPDEDEPESDFDFAELSEELDEESEDFDPPSPPEAALDEPFLA